MRSSTLYIFSLIFISLSLNFVSLGWSQAEVQLCRELYTKESRIGEGFNKRVYHVGEKKPDGSCWAEDCGPMVVKELAEKFQMATEAADITKLAIKLGIAPPLFAQGTCQDEHRILSFEIERFGTTHASNACGKTSLFCRENPTPSGSTA